MKLLKRKVPAIIDLYHKNKKILVNSSQIELQKEIKNARDSNGEPIALEKIVIKMDNKILKDGILPSVNSKCEKIIEYSYTDSSTGLVIVELRVEFYKESKKISTHIEEEPLFSLPTSSNYILSYDSTICKLIKQINDLTVDEYKEVLSCSLRTLFETGVNFLEESPKYGHLNLGSLHMNQRVEEIIKYIKNDQKFLTAIAKATKINFHTLNNLLEPNEYKRAIEKSHVGAHRSGKFLSVKDVEDISKKAGLFSVIVNEMLGNNGIK